MKYHYAEKVQNTAIYYCIFYMVMTVLYYVFLPFTYSFPLLAITGAHAPHYFLLFATLLLDANYVSSGGFLGVTTITVELLFLIALIIAFVTACWKKKYLPFWILSIFSNAFTIFTVLFAFFQNGDSVVISVNILFSIIGNTSFGYLLYRKIHRTKGASEHLNNSDSSFS